MVNYSKFLRILISFSIALSPIFLMHNAFAGAAKKWEVVQNVYDSSKKSVNLTAKKVTQEAANSAVYKVQVPVDPATLGSTVAMMIRGGVASAAVYALVEGVGWVIDEGSKVTKKPDDEGVSNPSNLDPSLEFAYKSNVSNKLYSHEINACDYLKIVNDGAGIPNSFVVYVENGFCYYSIKGVIKALTSVYREKNPNYNPSAPKPVPVVLTDAELGNEILGNGTQPNSKPQPAPDIIADAYSPNNPVPNAPAPQATNDALNNANPEPEKNPEGESKPKPNVDTDGDGKPDVYDPAKPSEGTNFTWPNACEWFPAACDFFKVQKQDNRDIKENQKEDIAQNKTFFEKIEDFFKDPDETNTELEFPDSGQQEINTDIKFSSSCPAKITLASFSYHGKQQNWDVDFADWCSSVTTYIRPIVISMGAFSAVLIVSGVRINE